MRVLFSFLAYAFTALAIVFSLMPMDTLAFLPIVLALVFSLLFLKKAKDSQKKIPNILMFICVLCSVFVIGKTLFIKDKVEKDTKFEQQIQQTNQESKKELEDLEKDLE